jgi:hypothetical protein
MTSRADPGVRRQLLRLRTVSRKTPAITAVADGERSTCPLRPAGHGPESRCS